MSNSGASVHYKGEKGRRYFDEAGRFTGRQDFGRTWQSKYFAPFCSADKVVLDFGCGDGTILRALPAQMRLAVEVNPYCIERIEQLNAAGGSPVSVQADVENWPTAVADVVISNHALEHVLSPIDALRGMVRVLRSGGLLVLMTPFDDWRSKGGRSWAPADRQNHLYTWSPQNIGNLVTEAGFTVVSSKVVSSAWSPKLFWIHHAFGEIAFAFCSEILGRVLNRRQVLTVARRP